MFGIFLISCSAFTLIANTADVCKSGEFGRLQTAEAAQNSAILRFQPAREQLTTVSDAMEQCSHPYDEMIKQAYDGFNHLADLHLKQELERTEQFMPVKVPQYLNQGDDIKAWSKATDSSTLLIFAASVDSSTQKLFDAVYPYGFCDDISEPIEKQVIKKLPSDDKIVRVHHEGECLEDVAVTKVFPGKQGAISFVMLQVDTPLVAVKEEIPRNNFGFRGFLMKPTSKTSTLWFAVHELRKGIRVEYEVDGLVAKMNACKASAKDKKR